MRSPVILPPTLILEGARHLVADFEPMLPVNIVLVLKTAGQESCIWVTHRVNVTNEVRVLNDIKIKYEVKARRKAEQVRCYQDPLKGPGLTIT